jgi:hypothetical protein
MLYVIQAAQSPLIPHIYSHLDSTWRRIYPWIVSSLYRLYSLAWRPDVHHIRSEDSGFDLIQRKSALNCCMRTNPRLEREHLVSTLNLSLILDGEDFDILVSRLQSFSLNLDTESSPFLT